MGGDRDSKEFYDFIIDPQQAGQNAWHNKEKVLGES
jgi:hypothetical protein